MLLLHHPGFAQLPLLVERQQAGRERPGPAENIAHRVRNLAAGTLVDPLVGQRRGGDEAITVRLEAAAQLQQGQVGRAKVFFLQHVELLANCDLSSVPFKHCTSGSSCNGAGAT
ncbi:hypothetical protein D3C80_685870 [compost metagenome]